MAGSSVGVVSPGEMGSAVAGSLVASGRTVMSVLAGRSSETQERARVAGVREARDLEELVDGCEVVVSIVPPAEAPGVARALADALRVTASPTLVVEANAVSPEQAAEMGQLLGEAGARFVDADLIGGPPGPGRRPTRLYLSGPDAAEAASLLGTPEVRPVVLGGPAMAASSLKMAYAAWSKGSAALVLAARALARHLGVEEALLSEWADSQPEAESRLKVAAERAGRAWRFPAEMEEISATLRAAGLPGGFADAAAETYLRLAGLKGRPLASVEEVLALLAGQT